MCRRQSGYHGDDSDVKVLLGGILRAFAGMDVEDYQAAADADRETLGEPACAAGTRRGHAQLLDQGVQAIGAVNRGCDSLPRCCDGAHGADTRSVAPPESGPHMRSEEIEHYCLTSRSRSPTLT
jgi:hypothetical protein